LSGKYQVLLYEDERGRSQVKEWLIRLEKSNPKARQQARRLMERLRLEGTDLRPPIAKRIKGKGKIWELRHRSGLRLYYWQDDDNTFIIAAGELKQRDKADPGLIEYAMRAFEEWRST